MCSDGAAPGWRPTKPRSLMIAGASAGIAAVFSSPALGTFYGMEVPFRRDARCPSVRAVRGGRGGVVHHALVADRPKTPGGDERPPDDRSLLRRRRRVVALAAASGRVCLRRWTSG